MLNAIIVDDEEFARSSLYFLLQEHCSKVQIAGIAKSVAEARNLLLTNIVNLIFLDIAMPGENGFELIPEIKQSNANVIFTTAYNQYALRAIKANALDYLLKPIAIDELKIAVEKATQHQKLNTQYQQKNENIQNLAHELNDTSAIKKITLPNGKGYSIIDVDNIIHLEADSNYSVFYLANSEKIAVSKTLKEYEEILPENKFVRIHKSSIVNLSYLKEYNGIHVVLKNGKTIAVSRRRATEFLEKIKIFTNLKLEK